MPETFFCLDIFFDNFSFLFFYSICIQEDFILKLEYFPKKFHKKIDFDVKNL